MDEIEDEQEEKVEEEQNEEVVNTISFDPTLSLTLSKLESSRIDLIFAANNEDPCYYLMVDHKPVATAKYKKASTNVRDIFVDQGTFKNAFIAAISTAEGIDPEQLDDFGFEPIPIEVEMDDAQRQQIEKQIQEKVDVMESKTTAIQKNLSYCLSIASVGINKGVFADIENPLKAKLYETLSSLGIRNSHKLIDSVFAGSMDDYNKILIAETFKLIEKSEPARSEVAKMVNRAHYQPVATNYEDIESEQVSDRLASASLDIVEANTEEEITSTTKENPTGNSFLQLFN